MPGCFPEDDRPARIAAARAVGLPDRMADEIKIIEGIPEWRPDEKPKRQAARPKKVVPKIRGSVGCWYY